MKGRRSVNKASRWAAWSFVFTILAAAGCSGGIPAGTPAGTSPAESAAGAPDVPAARVEEEEGGAVMSLELTSAAFTRGAAIPRQYTGDGPDVSPPLKWTDPPGGTKSFAVICDDPDAPMGTWVHWVIYGIPPETRELAEGVAKTETLASGAKQGVTDFRSVGYGGPAPPPGKPPRYFFKLYALDTELSLGPRMRKKDMVKAMEGHILAQGELMGTYQR